MQRWLCVASSAHQPPFPAGKGPWPRRAACAGPARRCSAPGAADEGTGTPGRAHEQRAARSPHEASQAVRHEPFRAWTTLQHNKSASAHLYFLSLAQVQAHPGNESFDGLPSSDEKITSEKITSQKLQGENRLHAGPTSSSSHRWIFS